MTSFVKTRGCVVTMNDGVGGYEISGFPKGTAAAPILLTDAMTNFKDIILPVTTLSNNKIIYTFGSDFGNVTLNGIVFLGQADTVTNGVAQVKEFYDSKSAGNKKSATPVSVSLSGQDVISVYIIGLGFGKPNPVFNYIPFSLSGIEA